MKRTDYDHRLKQNYARIIKSSLVNSADISEQSMGHFQRLLNSVQPSSDSEMACKTMLRRMKDGNRFGLSMFLKNRNSAHLVQWLDALTIVQHFKIQNLIFLKWDKTTQVFIVSQLRPREQELVEVPETVAVETKMPVFTRPFSAVVSTTEPTITPQTVPSTVDVQEKPSIGRWVDQGNDSE